MTVSVGTVEPFPAAASTAVAAVLTGPPRPLAVAAATPDAAYLATGHPDVPALCLCSSAAVRVPCAVVLGRGPTMARRLLAGLRVGAVGSAGAGTVTFPTPEPASAPIGSPTLTVRVARWWQPARPLLGGGSGLRPRAGGLPDVAALLGCGEGLTPYGDDVLAGAMVALAALGSPVAGSLVRRVLPAAFERTSFVSAALLVHAARGECIPELAAYLYALPGDDPARLAGTAVALHAVGGTSGAGLMEGVAAVVDVPAFRGGRQDAPRGGGQDAPREGRGAA